MKFFFIAILVAVGGFFLLKNNPQWVDIANQWIAGITKSSHQQKQSANTKKNTSSLSTNTPTIQKQILGIQQQISQLKVTELSSSSPQIQSILKQIQQLPQGSINQLKESCMQMCSRL